MINIQKKVNKIPQKLLIYKGYNFSQALIRFYNINTRVINKFRIKKKKISIKNTVLLSLSFLYQLKKLFKKDKSEIIIISNTRYKIQKALNHLSKKKNIALFQDFNHKIFENYYHEDYNIINKFLFLKFPKKNLIQSKNKNEFLMLQNKIDFFENMINFYNPKSVYVVEGDSVNDALIAQVCKKKKIKCFCFQHGYNPTLFNSTVLPKFEYKNYFYDFIFLADSYKSALFLKKKKLINRYKVVNNKILPNKLSEKKNIFFGIPTISPKENLDENIIKKIAQNINYFSKKYNNLKILVRLHPDGLSNKIILKKVSNLKNVEFHYPHEISLEDSFKSAKIGCFVFGTSLIADSLNNYCFPVILVDKKNSFNFKGLKKNKIAYLTSNENNFRNVVSNLLKDPIKIKIKQKLIHKFLKT